MIVSVSCGVTAGYSTLWTNKIRKIRVGEKSKMIYIFDAIGIGVVTALVNSLVPLILGDLSCRDLPAEEHGVDSFNTIANQENFIS